jgi:TfoX/Sxy family transcriptional regulator of competence genes
VAYDEDLAARVRRELIPRSDVTERKMFGGIAFMVAGNMCCGVNGEDLMLRLGSEGADAALDDPHVRPMDFTGRPMAGFVYVGPEGTATASDLRRWVDRALEFAATLPPKARN